jgi:hypothetical protein
MAEVEVFQEVAGFYRLIPLQPMRRTPGVWFDNIPLAFLPRIDAIDRVIHRTGAVSPGPVGEVSRPWYMHPHQDDNLIVLSGRRDVDIYHLEHGRRSFTVTPEQIRDGDGALVYDGPAMLVWPREVFHRIVSGPEGSASLNFAVHYPGMNPRTNFNIYELDEAAGKYRLIREGFRDQDLPPPAA